MAGVLAIVLCAVFLIHPALAQLRTVEREVNGWGINEPEAVLHALQEATFQICGVRIDSQMEVRSSFVEDDNNATMIETMNRERSAVRIRTAVSRATTSSR